MATSSDSGHHRYELVSDLGQGNFGVAKLAQDKQTGAWVAIKYIERGSKVDENVQREITCHRMLQHPNVIDFWEVFLTPGHLAIVMEYAAGGELFDRVCNYGRFGENEARYFFQQIIAGVHYLHQMQVSHRDVKLENALLDVDPQKAPAHAPRVKICDFGYSKSSLLHSSPKSTVGTPAYIAPEVLKRRQYDGHKADVWSCGVTLYVLMVGAYPFDDPSEPKNFRKTIERIMAVQYEIPDDVPISQSCKDLIEQIFVADPDRRISIDGIISHPWFRTNLPSDIDASLANYHLQARATGQSIDEINNIIQEARIVPCTNDCRQRTTSEDMLDDEAIEDMSV